jgi:hypothetical protein
MQGDSAPPLGHVVAPLLLQSKCPSSLSVSHSLLPSLRSPTRTAATRECAPPWPPMKLWATIVVPPPSSSLVSHHVHHHLRRHPLVLRRLFPSPDRHRMPLPPSRCHHRLLLPWSCHHGPPRAELGSLASPRGHPKASPLLSRRRHGPLCQKRRAPDVLCSKNYQGLHTGIQLKGGA